MKKKKEVKLENTSITTNNTSITNNTSNNTTNTSVVEGYSVYGKLTDEDNSIIDLIVSAISKPKAIHLFSFGMKKIYNGLCKDCKHKVYTDRVKHIQTKKNTAIDINILCDRCQISAITVLEGYLK